MSRTTAEEKQSMDHDVHEEKKQVEEVEEVEEDDDLGGTAGDGGEDVPEGEEEEIFAEDHQDESSGDLLFDETVGVLESLLLDSSFQSFHSAFLTRYCHEFDSSDENRLCYSNIHMEYQENMEEIIQSYLAERIKNFDMESFLSECESRGESQLCGDVWDVLTSITDFQLFKESMIAHKELSKQKEKVEEEKEQEHVAASSSSSSSMS